jgi:hypothetical protein
VPGDLHALAHVAGVIGLLCHEHMNAQDKSKTARRLPGAQLEGPQDRHQR